MLTPPPPLCLVWGPPGHGVTDYGADVARAARSIDRRVGIEVVSDLDDAFAALRSTGATSAHLHVTDRLLGDSPEQAAGALERLAAATALSITLHDVPQHSDGAMYRRRVAAYARFAAAATAVAVNSGHERMLLTEHRVTTEPPEVVPLGTRTAAAPDGGDPAPGVADAGAGPVPSDLIVLIAGFVYPGKGHVTAIDAAARAVRTLRGDRAPVGRAVVRALGGASAGHEGDLDDLRHRADASDVVFETTGFLSDERFAAALRGEGIPLAAHEHVSASRSMLDWVEAGRRPLVVDSRYAREAEALRPGTAIVSPRDDLAARLVEAWRDPSRTRLAAGHPLQPDLGDVAARYLAWWAR